MRGPFERSLEDKRRTRLHSERSTNAKERDEEDEGGDTARGRPLFVSRIVRQSTDDNEQHSGAEKLEKR